MPTDRVRIINCIVRVRCEDEEALGLFQIFCAQTMDAAARAAVVRLGDDTIQLVSDVRVGEEIPVDEEENEGLHE